MSYDQLELFNQLATIFNKHGFRLFMVGGTSRDFLLNRHISDYDFATDATPQDMQTMFSEANFRFAKFGTVLLKFQGEKVQITTFRSEGEYRDLRHPDDIVFVKEPSLDYKRRDFTINALYIDENYHVIDFCGGYEDLINHRLVMIGDPLVRFEEDPLRIIRALRFVVRFNLVMDHELEAAIKLKGPLLKSLNQAKISEEYRKVEEIHKPIFLYLIKKYQLD